MFRKEVERQLIYLVALQRDGEMIFPASRPQTTVEENDH